MDHKIQNIVQKQVDILTEVARILYAQDTSFTPFPVISECVEKFVLTQLFQKLFCQTRSEAKKDAYLYLKILKLKEFLKPQHLDIPKDLIDEEAWLNAKKGI